MISYEVTLKIDPAIEKDVIEFMSEEHIKDVLATGFFLSAVIEKSGDGTYRNRYTAESSDKVNEYLEKESPRLRDDVARRFPSGIEFSRAIFEEIAEFQWRRGT